MYNTMNNNNNNYNYNQNQGNYQQQEQKRQCNGYVISIEPINRQNQPDNNGNVSHGYRFKVLNENSKSGKPFTLNYWQKRNPAGRPVTNRGEIQHNPKVMDNNFMPLLSYINTPFNQVQRETKNLIHFSYVEKPNPQGGNPIKNLLWFGEVKEQNNRPNPTTMVNNYLQFCSQNNRQPNLQEFIMDLNEVKPYVTEFNKIVNPVMNQNQTSGYPNQQQY